MKTSSSYSSPLWGREQAPQSSPAMTISPPEVKATPSGSVMLLRAVLEPPLPHEAGVVLQHDHVAATEVDKAFQYLLASEGCEKTVTCRIHGHLETDINIDSLDRRLQPYRLAQQGRRCCPFRFIPRGLLRDPSTGKVFDYTKVLSAVKHLTGGEILALFPVWRKTCARAGFRCGLVTPSSCPVETRASGLSPPQRRSLHLSEWVRQEPSLFTLGQAHCGLGQCGDVVAGWRCHDRHAQQNSIKPHSTPAQGPCLGRLQTPAACHLA